MDPEHLQLRSQWILTAWGAREPTLAKGHTAGEEFWGLASRRKEEFTVCTQVFVQTH